MFREGLRQAPNKQSGCRYYSLVSSPLVKRGSVRLTAVRLKRRALESNILVLVQLLMLVQIAVILTYHVFYFVATERLIHDKEFRHVSAV